MLHSLVHLLYVLLGFNLEFDCKDRRDRYAICLTSMLARGIHLYTQ
jgi:hypothetical protein